MLPEERFNMLVGEFASSPGVSARVNPEGAGSGRPR